MTIEFTCQQCDNSLRVGSENAGKTSRCPRCGTPNVVPFPATTGEEIPVAPLQSAPDVPENQSTEPVKRFFVDTDFGQTYGPVTQPQLDQWVTEGRVTAQYVIREEGAQGGFYASQMYPALAEGPSASLDPQPPYVKAGPPGKVSGQNASGFIEPTGIKLGDAFDHAFVVLKNNMGLLLGTSVTIFFVNVACQGMERVADRTNDQALAGLLYMGSALAGLISVYLVIGQAQICLKLARGLSADFMDLFKGGIAFIYVCLFGLLIGTVGAIPLLLILFIASFLGPISGLIAIVLIAAAWIALWPAYFLLVDRKANVFSCFALSTEIATPNIGNTILIFLASIGLTIVGILALCVGVIFSNAYIALLWATAYLMMSGQVQPQKYN